MATDHLAVQERVKLNKDHEKKCIECLNRHLAKKGHKLLYGGEFEDKVNKTDAFLVSLDNLTDRSRRCAVKIRESRNDILVAVYDPFYGVDHCNTKEGRDMVVEYYWYITRDNNKKHLRVADGKEVHRIVMDIWDEFMDPAFLGNVLVSKKHPGCEMRKHPDRHDGHPKILAFIPPSYLKENVFFVPYDEESDA